MSAHVHNIYFWVSTLLFLRKITVLSNHSLERKTTKWREQAARWYSLGIWRQRTHYRTWQMAWEDSPGDSWMIVRCWGCISSTPLPVNSVCAVKVVVLSVSQCTLQWMREWACPVQHAAYTHCDVEHTFEVVIDCIQILQAFFTAK